MPDLAWEAEAWAVLRLRIPQAQVPEAGKALHFLEVTARGEDLKGAPVPLAPVLLSLPSMSLPRQCESRAIININGAGLELPI